MERPHVMTPVDESALVGAQAPLVTALAILGMGHEELARALCDLAYRSFRGEPRWRQRLGSVAGGADLERTLREALVGELGVGLGQPDAPPLDHPGVAVLSNGGVPDRLNECIERLEDHLSRWPNQADAGIALAHAYRYLWVIETHYRATWARLGLPPLDIEAAAILAECDTTEDKRRRMFEHFVAALSDDPEALARNAGIHETLANWLRDVGRPNEAALQHRLVLIAANEHAMSQKGLGEMLLGQGANAEAIRFLERALPGLQGLPSGREIHARLGIGYRNGGEPLRAIEHFFDSVAPMPWRGVV